MTTTYVCHGCGARLTPAEMARFDQICGDPCPTCDASESAATSLPIFFAPKPMPQMPPPQSWEERRAMLDELRAWDDAQDSLSSDPS